MCQKYTHKVLQIKKYLQLMESGSFISEIIAW